MESIWWLMWPLACLACDPARGHAPQDPNAWHALVSAEAWAPAAIDPFPEHRPEQSDCSPRGWYPESGGLEIVTGRCSYLSLEQPLLEEIEAGDSLRISAWWQTLSSVEPATAHVALVVGGDEAGGGMVIWEEYIAIPGPADARDIEAEALVPAPRGTPVRLHLHNHGYNSWNFHEFAVLKEHEE